MNARHNREKMTEIMFETFQVPGIFIGCSSVLALYGSGRTTGVVVESGHGVSHIYPIYDGFAINRGVVRLEYSGRTLTDYLLKLLAKRGHMYKTTAEREMVQEVKEQMCYVAKDYDDELNKAEKEGSGFVKQVEMTNGEIVSIGSEMFQCPELLFHPELIGMEAMGIHEAVEHSIKNCEYDIRKELAKNILISGGTTLLPGFDERLRTEVEYLRPYWNPRVIALEERKYSVYMGASVLASLTTFPTLVATKQEYAEIGASIIHRKF